MTQHEREPEPLEREALRAELYEIIKDGLGEAWGDLEWDDEDCAAMLGTLDGLIARRERAAAEE